MPDVTLKVDILHQKEIEILLTLLRKYSDELPDELKQEIIKLAEDEQCLKDSKIKYASK